MNADKIKAVKAEMKRFSAAIKELESAVIGQSGRYIWAPKQTGAVRRASMDLTRALAEFRKPD